MELIDSSTGLASLDEVRFDAQGLVPPSFRTRARARS